MPAHPINAPALLQSAEDPDMLTLVPLAGVGQGTEVEGAGRQVPWFGAVKGFCLVSVRLRCFVRDPGAVARRSSRCRLLVL